jgi:multiple sugar transport system permease protein
VLGGAAGYALARFPIRLGRLNNDNIATTFLVQRMMPPAVLLVPFLIMYRILGMLDTKHGLVLVYSALSIPFVVWVMRDFFATIPEAIEESALIDGCSRIGVLFRIAIPLAAPGFVSAFVLTMIGSWNEFLLALSFSFNKTVTIPMFMMFQMHGSGGGRGTMFNNIAVVALFAAVPITTAGLLLERYITRGLTYGAVK